MKMRKILALILAAAMVLGLSGCFEKPMDAATLAQKLTGAMTAVDAFSQETELEAEMSITMSGVTLDIGMEMEMETAFSGEPFGGYFAADMTMKVMGQNEKISMESYYTMEDDAQVAYSYDSTSDSWLRQELPELTEANQLAQTIEEVGNLDPETLTLAEETQLIGQTEVYVLSGTMTGEQIQGAFSALMGSMTDELDEETTAMLEDMDLSAVSVPFVYYIDTATFLPLKMEIQIQGLGEAMQGMMDTLIEESMGVLGGEVQLEMTVEIPEFTVVMENFVYEDVEIPDVPQEVMEAAEMNPNRGDGSYVLHCGEEAVRIVPPEDYQVHGVDETGLMMTTSDCLLYVLYSVDTESTEEDHEVYVSEHAAFYEDSDTKLSDIREISGFRCQWTHGIDGSCMAYAWKEMGDGWLTLEIQGEGKPEDILTGLLSVVEDYEG